MKDSRYKLLDLEMQRAALLDQLEKLNLEIEVLNEQILKQDFEELRDLEDTTHEQS